MSLVIGFPDESGNDRLNKQNINRNKEIKILTESTEKTTMDMIGLDAEALSEVTGGKITKEGEKMLRKCPKVIASGHSLFFAGAPGETGNYEVVIRVKFS